MALLDKDERRVVTGILVGAGIAWIAPQLAPALLQAAKPLFKAVLRVGLVGLDTGREVAAHVQEAASDAWAEVQVELAREAGLPPQEVELQQQDSPEGDAPEPAGASATPSG
ncbi:MAG: hypothetical protein MJD61_09545 [Proteobacteria bacterium]|nr:hypothetical protein [Pseudomonadota bacterium]